MKKIIASVMTMVLILSITAFPASASSGVNPGYAPEENFTAGRSVSGDGPVGAPLHSEVITDADRQAHLEKFNAIPKGNLTTRAAAAVSWQYIPTSSYPIYAQENDYYCGPAAVRTMLNFFNGSAPSQTIIAGKIGTTSIGTYMKNIEPYLNDNSSFYYAIFSGNQSDMKECLYDTVANSGAPGLVGCKYTKGGPWRYTTAGHYLTVYGTTSDQSQFMLSDSWIKYKGIDGEPYTAVTASQLYTAYTAAGIGLLW